MKRKIAIADDSEVIRSLLQMYLSEDFEVSTHADGTSLLQSIKIGQIPELIIADVNMPGLGGWELLQNLQVSQFFKQIPVIILSANDKSQERINFLKAGALDFLIKPFNPEELKIKIQNILKRKTYES